ncbi:hypothetical protein GLOIN_2v1766467 [Rhizophagus irregularis DAOM 181602=DAOM 197198]|nr:hypothetical protein GLOIN_2v1766467 [Rhizophagus irregularis DAOM 181602=DAOM 197198]
MGKSTIQKYLQPRHSGTKEAKLNHYPAQIRLAAVGRNEMNEHIDEHYCLASVKGVKSFASVKDSAVIGQLQINCRSANRNYLQICKKSAN